MSNIKINDLSHSSFYPSNESEYFLSKYESMDISSDEYSLIVGGMMNVLGAWNDFYWSNWTLEIEIPPSYYL
jgi:hypothetical protein